MTRDELELKAGYVDAMIYKLAVPKYVPDPGVSYNIFWLQNTVSEVIRMGVSESQIREVIDASDIAKELYQNIDFAKAFRDSEIRSDWAAALRGVRKSTQLSSAIGWAFSDKDIAELAKLHKAKKFRQKIEDLLEDCNFHYECGKFAEEQYDEFLTPKEEIA